VDVVDPEAARARGGPVCNAPGANADSVAQNALLLILALARRLPEARRAFAEARIGVPPLAIGNSPLAVNDLFESPFDQLTHGIDLVRDPLALADEPVVRPRVPQNA